MKKRWILTALVVVAGSGLVLWFTSPGVLLGQAGGPEIVLYTGENFTGRALSVRGTVLDFPREKDLDESLFDWNDKVRSLVVLSGTWRLYQHGRLNTRLDDTRLEELDVTTKRPALGWSALVSATAAGQLEIADLGAAGLGQDISSIELISAENLPEWTFKMRRP